jgi:hypothetical protein
MRRPLQDFDLVQIDQPHGFAMGLFGDSLM